MSVATKPASMNEANERDPYNNNSFGTLVDSGYKLVNLPVLDVCDFNEREKKRHGTDEFILL